MLTATDVRTSKTAKIKKLFYTLTYDDVQQYSKITGSGNPIKSRRKMKILISTKLSNLFE